MTKASTQSDTESIQEQVDTSQNSLAQCNIPAQGLAASSRHLLEPMPMVPLLPSIQWPLSKAM